MAKFAVGQLVEFLVAIAGVDSPSVAHRAHVANDEAGRHIEQVLFHCIERSLGGDPLFRVPVRFSHHAMKMGKHIPAVTAGQGMEGFTDEFRIPREK